MANKILNICQSKLKESKSTFVWKIHNFSDRRQNANESLESGIFNSTSPSGELVMWSLHINYPNTNSDKFNISVNLVDTAASEVSAKIKFMIRNSKGTNVEKLIIRNCIFEKGQQYEPPKHLIDRNELYNAGNGFLPDDRLTIVFEVTIFEPMMAMEYGIVDEFDFPEFSAIEDMGHLFEQRLFTDCILVTEDGIKFEVHKGIVSCRSPVFRAMFAHEMIEAKEGIVRIKDVKSPVLEQMLKFMYSGKAPKLGEMALELFEASDRYEFDQLKIISCEKELATSMGNENVCELLVLANQHSAQYLKMYAIKYIQKNAKEVMKSDGWKMLVEGNYGELFDQIMKAIYD